MSMGNGKSSSASQDSRPSTLFAGHLLLIAVDYPDCCCCQLLRSGSANLCPVPEAGFAAALRSENETDALRCFDSRDPI